ncbi:MAG: diaminopimelate epimerase [Winogradskyella sp.]
MRTTFYKYQGTGNDFIIVDNRLLHIDKTNTKRIAQLCDRRFGVGADGFILLENDNDTDFKMVYFNADGNESSMCGNGGRCIVAFAKFLGVIKNETKFIAVDGIHNAKIENDIVHLQMQNVDKVEVFKTHSFIDTGSPHHVALVSNLENFEVKFKGSKIRNGEPYNEAGTNVNFVEQISEAHFAVRTYERGVEDETLSCGTGATAVALAMHKTGKTTSKIIQLKTQGGNLTVTFNAHENGYNAIWLVGAAQQVFKGELVW